MICVYMVYIKAMERGDKEGSLSQGVCKQKKKKVAFLFLPNSVVCVINSFNQNVGKKGVSKAATYQVAGRKKKGWRRPAPALVGDPPSVVFPSVANDGYCRYCLVMYALCCWLLARPHRCNKNIVAA